MANKALSSKARESALAQVVGRHITDTGDLLNAVDFVESPAGLGVTLYPIQRLLLKLSQGIPIDYKEAKIPVHDIYGEKLLYTFTEREYLKYAHDQGRLNVGDWQDARQGGYPELCFLVGRRGGKAVALDTPVPTPNGFKPMRDIQTGDVVFAPNGQPTKVALAHEPFEDTVYKVSFEDGTEVTAHGGHLWRFWDRSKSKYELLRTNQIGGLLRRGGLLNLTVQLPEPIQYPEQPLPETPTTVGKKIAMGHLDYHKGIPEVYLRGSVAQRWELLLAATKLTRQDLENQAFVTRFHVITRYEVVAKQLRELIASLGMFSPIYPGDNLRDSSQQTFRVSWARCDKRKYVTNCVRLKDKATVKCITVTDPDGLFLVGHSYTVTHNSQLTSAITAYRLYKLLAIKDPQSYYGLVPGSPIDIVLLAQDEGGADRLFKKLREDVLRSPFFSPYLKAPNSRDLAFITEADRGKKEATATIMVSSLACTTRAARGPSAIVLCLDEFAHFKSASGASSAEVYDAASPSTLQFKHPITDMKDSQIIIVTSPLQRLGTYYDLYSLGLKDGPSGDILSFMCSTAEMNPRTPKGSLKKEERKNPITFKCEYGGMFSDSSESYVKSNSLDRCVDKGRANVVGFDKRLIGTKFFWGFDLGMRNDASALAIGHWLGISGRPVLHIDYIDRMMVGLGEFESDIELQYKKLMAWLEAVNRYLPCYNGLTDQHGGTLLVQMLKAQGIDGMELVHLSDLINSKMYSTMRLMIDQGTISLPDNEDFLKEVKQLETIITNKYRIRVGAPNEKGAHDDMADAVALVAYAATEWAQTPEGSRELLDIVQNPHMVQRSNLINQGDYHPIIQYASMHELKMLDTLRKLQKQQNGAIAGVGNGLPRKYR